jgi:ribonuclease P protein component
MALRLITLKKRAEFLRVRGGGRWATPGFVLEGKARGEADADGARFGFTITKATGNAVARNRIRRRLRAVIGKIDARHAEPSFDYVLIARAAASTRTFADLEKDLEQALYRVHHPRRGKRRREEG